jgi:U3 small nucleolar ribonucleoprotein protein IMP4
LENNHSEKSKMLRRAARERREFVYRKTIEQRQKAIEERRERLKNALDGFKTLIILVK